MLNTHKQTQFKELALASNCTCSPQDLQPFGECICTIPKKAKTNNKVKLKIESLEAAIKTLDFKIKTLTPYFSQAQIRVWRKNRRNLNKQLKFFKGVLKLANKQVTAAAILADIKRGQITLLDHLILKSQARKQEAQDFANEL